ncbi:MULTISPECIES: (2Fe-2S)-binding protein [Streptacidiphilus]|uniref:(2Fe-2S)-binding protein n=1 Tax=Streptacidiphilus cavernicola TaxID=3342716 RepID=A0ABV6V0P1_9ACTN|nr:(2Fe-2S)-binding protein [Streptacidiphilus jeojiense]
MDQLAALGPFFALDTHHRDEPARPPWQELRTLVEDPAVLRERVDGVRGHLAAAGGQDVADVELRVAASVAQLGLTARLVSPTLGVAVLSGRWPRPALDLARWQPVPGGAFPLSFAAAAFEPGTPDDLLAGPVRELVLATAGLSVSPKVLWGNVASAVNGAATVLAGARPELAAEARAAAALLLAHPLLRGTVATVPPGTGRFRRRSCCLIYRAAPGGAGALCGDCVLSR